MARPILLGVGGEAAKLVEAAGGGLHFQPENAEQLVAAVLRLADEPELGQRLGQSGRAYVTAHFDRGILAERYLSLIESLAGGSTKITSPNAR